jgi:hypothetical protein
MYTKCWWGNLEQRDSLKDVAVDGRIILESVLKKQEFGAWKG